MKTHTQSELRAALTVFIESGSADGREDMRRACLRLVPVLAIAPAMREALSGTRIYGEWGVAVVNSNEKLDALGIKERQE